MTEIRTEIQTEKNTHHHYAITGRESSGAAAAQAGALRRTFRMTFGTIFMDLLKAPAAEKAPAPKGPAETPVRREEAKGPARDADRPAPQTSAPEAAPARAAEAPRAEAARAAEAPRSEAAHAERPAPETKGAEAQAAEESKEAGRKPKGERTAETAARPAEAALRRKVVEIEGAHPSERPTGRAEIRELARKIRDLLEDPEATEEDWKAAIVAIAQVLGVPREEAAAAVEAAPAEDAEERPRRLRRALERIERNLLAKCEEAPTEARGEHAATSEERAAQTPADRDDPLARLVRKVEHAARKVEAAEARTEAKTEAEDRNAAAPETPRFERRSDEAAKRANGPTFAASEAIRTAAVAQVAPPQSAEASGVAAAAKARVALAVRPAAEFAVEAGARGASQGRSEGQHFAFGEYGRNESQRAKFAPEARPVVYRSPVEEDVMREVVRRAKVVIKDGRSEATIELKPEFLGRLSLKIAVEEGRASVTLRAENAAVRAMLEANIDQLRKSLAEAGLEVTMLEVGLGGAGFGAADADREGAEAENRNGRNREAQAGEGDVDDIDVAVTLAEAETYRAAARPSRVSLVA